jgi:hypothetical protein
VNSLDDLTPLLRRENALGHIDLGNRHARLPSLIGYLATVCLV